MKKIVVLSLVCLSVVGFGFSGQILAQESGQEVDLSGDRQEAIRLFEAGYLQASEGLRSEALRSYEEALKIDPGLGEYFLEEGTTFYFLGRTYEAIDNFQKAKELFEVNHDYQHLKVAEEYLDEIR